MARKGRAPLRKLVDVVAQVHPDLEDPLEMIRERRVSVDGRVVDNPSSLVRSDVGITLVRKSSLRGEAKLSAALELFGVSVDERVAVDLGAAAGGFTRVLLRMSAAKVYAVDVGFGQLLGSLRQDPRVVNLERTNVSALNRELIPDRVDLVTADVSYLSLVSAVGQLTDRVRLADDADVLGLVKPQFELHSSNAPSAAVELAAAVEAAIRGIERVGWTVHGTIESPVRGSRGAREFLLHGARAARRT